MYTLDSPHDPIEDRPSRRSRPPLKSEQVVNKKAATLSSPPNARERRRPLEAAAEGMHVIAAFSLFGLAFLILADIVLRLLGRPIAGTAELVANAVVGIAFLQLPHAVRCGGFLRVELLDGMLPASARRGLYVVSCALGALLFVAVAYSAWPGMVEAWRIGEYDGVADSLKVPTAPTRSILVFASLFAAVNFAVMLLDALALRRGSQP